MLLGLHVMKFFTTKDLVKGYYKIEMKEVSIEKTVFTTPVSHWEFLRIPFGVKNGPVTFQRHEIYPSTYTQELVYGLFR